MRQPVIVENQPGANGGLAAGQVTRSTPDGYTLFMAVDTNLVVNPSTDKAGVDREIGVNGHEQCVHHPGSMTCPAASAPLAPG